MSMPKTSLSERSKLGDFSEERITEFRRDGCTVVRGCARRKRWPLCGRRSPRRSPTKAKVLPRCPSGPAPTPAPSSRSRTYGGPSIAFATLRCPPALPKWHPVVGVPGIRLYHDQALFKEPGGGVTPWHQDQGYWPFRGWGPVTMWMPLVDLTAEMGGSMSFARGSCHLALGDLEDLG